jgi:hypothetical protein
MRHKAPRKPFRRPQTITAVVDKQGYDQAITAVVDEHGPTEMVLRLEWQPSLTILS